MKKNKLSYLNDKIAKTVLAKEDVNIRNYVARIISHTTGIPYELLENNLSLVYPEVPTNGDVIKSTVDLAFTNNYQYFNIEIYYGKSKTERIKNVSYLFQLSLRQLKTYKNYKDLKPVIQIVIHAYDPIGKGDLVYEAAYMDKKYHIVYDDSVTTFAINLEYFKKIEYTKIKLNENKSLLQDLALFVIDDEKFLRSIYGDDVIMGSIYNELKSQLNSIDELMYYDEEDLQRQIEDEMTTKGRKEAQIKIAKSLIKLGKISIDDISLTTGLTIEEIEKLKDKE